LVVVVLHIVVLWVKIARSRGIGGGVGVRTAVTVWVAIAHRRTAWNFWSSWKR
jgi:hypothetical protein